MWANAGGGWRVVSGQGGWGGRCGLTAHRGVLHPDEYVDVHVFQALFERELGFTIRQVRSVHRQGRLSADQLALRSRVDARLLALTLAGGNMTALAQVVGLRPESLRRALARAR